MIAILGAGGHGKVIASVLDTLAEDYIFFDDAGDNPIQNFSVGCFIVGIGDNAIRKRVYDQVRGIPTSVIHPLSLPLYPISPGKGVFVGQNVILQKPFKVGWNVILNNGCQIDHDCVIHPHAHIAPGAVLCGGVTVGEGALVGANATVLPGSFVPPWTLVRAGSVYKYGDPYGNTHE